MGTDRRTFLKVSGTGLAALTIPGIAAASVTESPVQPGKFPFTLGVASYSFRKFPVERQLK